MKIDLLNNSGVISFRDDLEEKMLTAKSFDIATAFITHDAVNLIRIFLRRNKNQNRIGRLITGFYQCFNSKEVLVELQELAEKSRGRLLISIAKNERFHWKYYHFKIPDTATYYIGSSNFTEAGTNKKGELMLRLALNNKDKSEREQFDDMFNREFENSINILKIPLDDYKQSKTAKVESVRLPFSIRKILQSNGDVASIAKAKGIFTILLTADLSAKTVKIVKETKSNWTDCYYTCYGKVDYDAAVKIKSLLIIERYGHTFSFSLAEVIDDCRINTHDGNYFIAYKVKKTKGRETNALRDGLEALGVNYHSRRFKTKTLRIKQASNILSLFAMRRENLE